MAQQILNGVALGAGFALGSIVVNWWVAGAKALASWLIGEDDIHGR